MPKITIKSDGSVEGTQLTVDGTDITADDNVVSANFNASVRWGKWVSFGYSTRQTNEDGSTEITEYSFHSPPDDEEDYPTIRKVKRPAGLGQPTEDEAANEAALLASTRTVGDRLGKELVIDRSKLRPEHARTVQELMKGKKYKVIDKPEEEPEEEDTESG